jgi:hypothetical protein
LFLKEKKEKKKAVLNDGVARPKGNGIKDGMRKGYCVYAVITTLVTNASPVITGETPNF